jgi:hypothetical protein
MKRINQIEVYNLGKSIQAVALLDESSDPIDTLLALIDCEHHLGTIMSAETMEFRFSKPEAAALKRSISSLLDQEFRNEEGGLVPPDPNALQNWHFSPIRTAAGKFETNLAAELREAATYFVPMRGIFDTGKLIDAAEEHIPEKCRKKMNEMALDDLRSAGRCLAFNLSTAAGFHTMRCVEAVLEDYWKMFGGPGKKKNMGMNDFLKALDEYEPSNDPKPSEGVLGALRQAKDLDRNPLMHPRKSLSDEDALRLFSLAVGALIAMLQEMPDLDVAVEKPDTLLLSDAG